MAQVAAYLTKQLEQLGLEVQPLAVRDPQTGVTLHVVAGRLRGRDPTGAVLFVAHPDSVPWGPGGGDNATGAATLLETARALTAGPPTRNDIIFLFDDGEELGDYRGGHLFAERHPWMREVKLSSVSTPLPGASRPSCRTPRTTGRWSAATPAASARPSARRSDHHGPAG